ncbi:MAG: hypothetical protein K0R54_680 [Clostridiaceae bacterium]|jgi:hypothetical protein|nr:hypothetical protein [Clostridiaceae bacterium]
MKILDQNGKEQEVLQLEQNGCNLFGQPKNIKKPKVLLGTYSSVVRTMEVMAEAYCINSQDKNIIFEMPNE